MNKRNIIIFIIGMVTVLGGFFWFFYQYLKKNINTNSPQTGNIAQDDGLSQKVQSLDTELSTFEDRIGQLESLSDSVLGEKVQQLDTTLDAIEHRLDAIEYVPITITAFTNSVNTIEKGSVVTSIDFNYTTNKVPTSLIINNGIGTVNETTVTKAVNISNNTIYELTATDGKTTVKATTGVNFINRIFWGVLDASTQPTNAQVISLPNSVLSGSRVRNFTLAGQSKYPAYCYPASLGAANYKVGGFAYNAFNRFTMNVTNASGFTESYFVDVFTQNQSGTITIEIS